MTKSILDQVMTSQRLSALSNFDPETVAGALFSILNERERDIITKRHGLDGKPKVTLEDIGKIYKVTRERVRQVENASLRRLRDSYKESLLKDLEALLRALLEEHGEIMSESRIIQTLLETEAESERHQALLRFVVNQLLKDRFRLEKDSKDLYKSWALQTSSLNRFSAIIKHLADIVEERGEPMTLDELLTAAKAVIADEHLANYDADTLLLNYLDITKQLEENRFGEWGASHWPTIRPKRMNDKIYLIMKKERKPLHFTEIAKKINEAGFDARTAYPATIHNELILDGKYVLVGRGIYALKEWGYKPGIVLDVIRQVLQEHGKALSRDEIVKEVLKNRMVKRSTVMLALMNKKHFSRDANGDYNLSAG